MVRFSLQIDVAGMSLNESYKFVGSQQLFSVLRLLYPQKKLQEYAGFFYVPLVMRFVNEESSLCRKLTNAVIKSLLEKVSTYNINDCC